MDSLLASLKIEIPTWIRDTRTVWFTIYGYGLIFYKEKPHKYFTTNNDILSPDIHPHEYTAKNKDNLELIVGYCPVTIFEKYYPEFDLKPYKDQIWISAKIGYCANETFLIDIDALWSTEQPNKMISLEKIIELQK